MLDLVVVQEGSGTALNQQENSHFSMDKGMRTMSLVKIIIT
jgi:hypothetical protein